MTFHSVRSFIIPTDELIFFRGVETTNQVLSIPQMLHGAGILTYMCAIFGVNVGKYSMHGASGYGVCF